MSAPDCWFCDKPASHADGDNRPICYYCLEQLEPCGHPDCDVLTPTIFCDEHASLPGEIAIQTHEPVPIGTCSCCHQQIYDRLLGDTYGTYCSEVCMRVGPTSQPALL